MLRADPRDLVDTSRVATINTNISNAHISGRWDVFAGVVLLDLGHLRGFQPVVLVGGRPGFQIHMFYWRLLDLSYSLECPSNIATDFRLVLLQLLVPLLNHSAYPVFDLLAFVSSVVQNITTLNPLQLSTLLSDYIH